MLFEGTDAYVRWCACAFISSTAYISTNMLFDGLVVYNAAASRAMTMTSFIVIFLVYLFITKTRPNVKAKSAVDTCSLTR